MILDSPYKGLVPFEDTELDALLFYGRERESEIIAANVLAARLTVLYGPSGVGKSSVLRAGVAHRLRRLARENVAEGGHPEFAVVVFDTWSDDPVGSLRAAVREELSDQFGSALLDERKGETLADTLGRWTESLACDLLLVLDQAEEYFLYHGEETGFARELPELVTGPGLRVRVLLALRDDALAKLDRFKGRIPNLFANYLRLDHLDRSSARDAITKPVERYNEATGQSIAVEAALIGAVLDQTAAGKVDLGDAGRGLAAGETDEGRIEAPYLQLVLERIWEEEREVGSSLLRAGTLASLGGAEAIVRAHLHRAVEALSADEKDLAADVFRYLVTPSGAKVAHGAGDLAEYASVDEQRLLPVLSTLGRERIVRPVDGANGDGGRYEIFHDVLGGAVLAWRRERELERARRTAERRNRRLALLAAGALVALVLMTGLAAYAFSQRSEAQKQTAEASAQRSEAEQALIEAEDAQEEAEEQTQLAEKREAQARDAEAYAERQAKLAHDLNVEADTQKRLAISGEKDADEARKDAQAAQADSARHATNAEQATEVAKREAKNARMAKNKAVAAERRAQARSLIARSVLLLASDPERSAAFAVDAADLAVRRGDLLDAENALRAALVTIRVQHIFPGVGSDGARVARFSSDGRRVVAAVGGSSRALRIFRARDGRLLQTFRATRVLNDAALSPDGRFVAAGAADGRVWIWNVDTGAVVRHLNHDSPVSGVIWSPKGDVLVSVGGDPNPSARIWDASTGDLLHPIAHPLPLTGAVFSADGRRLATYGTGFFARIFAVKTGVQISTIRYMQSQFTVTNAEFSPGGDLIATSRGNFARLWNPETGESVRAPLGTHGRTVTDITFSPDGTQVATASVDTLAHVFTVASGAIADVIHGHSGLGINDVDFSPDSTPASTAVVTAGADKTVRYSATGQLPVLLLGHKDAVLGASFSPDGRSILSASKDGNARLWDPYGEPVPRTLPVSNSSDVTSVAVDLAGLRIAVGRRDGGVQVLSPDGRVISTPISEGPRVVNVAWARGQTLLAATTDGHVKIWSNAGERPRELDHEATIRAAAISTDGKRVVTAGQDGKVRVWRLPAGTFRTLEHEGAVTSVALDPAGRLVATASGDVAYIWRVSDGEMLEKLEPEGETDTVTGVTFGAKGRLLATSSEDSRARIWNVQTGRLMKTLVRHGTPVVGVAFSPDGRWLVTAAARKAAVWQVGKSDLEGSFLFFVAPPRNPQAPIALTSVAFSQRDLTIVIGSRSSRNGTVRTYKCRFCGRLPRLVPIAKAKLAHLKDEARR